MPRLPRPMNGGTNCSVCPLRTRAGHGNRGTTRRTPFRVFWRLLPTKKTASCSPWPQGRERRPSAFKSPGNCSMRSGHCNAMGRAVHASCSSPIATSWPTRHSILSAHSTRMPWCEFDPQEIKKQGWSKRTGASSLPSSKRS